MKELRGIGVGFRPAWGITHLLQSPAKQISETIIDSDIESAFKRIMVAAEQVSQRYLASARSKDAETVEILNALAMAALDPALKESIRELLGRGSSAEAAVLEAMSQLTSSMGEVEFLAERTDDFQNLAWQIVWQMQGKTQDIEVTLDKPVVIFAEELSPLELVALPSNVVGLVTKDGGPTSHTSILCRQRGIAALVACDFTENDIEPGFPVELDPIIGIVRSADQEISIAPIVFRSVSASPLVSVLANVGDPAEARSASNTKATGIGLVRTEFCFMDRTTMPSVEEQHQVYQEIADSFTTGEVIFRTFDVAGDKKLDFIDTDLSEATKEQLLALSKVVGNVSVMAPLIANSGEAEVFASLAREYGFEKIGVMLEKVSLLDEVEALQGVVDFISIGTNDLAQDLFQQDRLNPANPELLDFWQPELLRAIASATQTAKSVGIEVGVCGDAASDPIMAVVLAGMGVEKVSSAVSVVEEIHLALCSVTMDEARSLATLALASEDRLTARKAVGDAFRAIAIR